MQSVGSIGQTRDSRRMRTRDAAAYTGLSVSTLEKLRVLGGGPPFLKLGRAVVYDEADLSMWLASRRRTSTSDGGR
jgi:predicted DNA-binding transcriptional regulator AlpA